MMTEFRELTSEDLVRLSEVKKMRTKSQRCAFRMLPECMRLVAEQDGPVAFAEQKNVYFPDILFREQRICIEIDGGIHYQKYYKDKYRDSVFCRHGFTTIRIKNKDTKINVVYWQRVLEGLNRIYWGESREDICKMKIALESLINNEIRKWTMLEE